MVKEQLVDKQDLEAGRSFVRKLRGSDFRLEAAFWNLDELTGEWRLVMATPLVHKEGRLVAYDKLRRLGSVLGFEQDLSRLIRDIDLVSPSEGVITAFDIGSEGRIPVDRWILKEFVGGVWVAGAYVYLFEPRTFMTPEDTGDDTEF